MILLQPNPMPHSIVFYLAWKLRCPPGHRFLRNPVHRSAAQMCRERQHINDGCPAGHRFTSRHHVFNSVNRCSANTITIKGQQALHICAALRCTGLRKNRCPDGHPMPLPSSDQIPYPHPTLTYPSFRSNPLSLPVKFLEKSLSGEINLIPLSGQSEGLAEVFYP